MIRCKAASYTAVLRATGSLWSCSAISINPRLKTIIACGIPAARCCVKIARLIYGFSTSFPPIAFSRRAKKETIRAPWLDGVPPYLRIGELFAGCHHSTLCILAFAQAIARHWRQNAVPLRYPMLFIYHVVHRV